MVLRTLSDFGGFLSGDEGSRNRGFEALAMDSKEGG